MKCWICGVEPYMVDVSTLNDPQPRYMPGEWPESEDRHRHAERPPTPSEIEQAGHEAFRRIQEAP